MFSTGINNQIFNSDQQEVYHLGGIPKEIWLHHIFPYLDLHSLLKIPLLSKRFYVLAQDDNLWQKFCKFDFLSPFFLGKNIRESIIQNNQFKSAAKKEELQCIQTLKGHTHWIASLFFANNILFSGYGNGTIKLWKLDSQNNQLTSTHIIKCSSCNPEGHSWTIGALFYANGMLFSGSKDQTIKVWSYPSQTITKT